MQAVVPAARGSFCTLKQCGAAVFPGKLRHGRFRQTSLKHQGVARSNKAQYETARQALDSWPAFINCLRMHRSCWQLRGTKPLPTKNGTWPELSTLAEAMAKLRPYLGRQGQVCVSFPTDVKRSKRSLNKAGCLDVVAAGPCVLYPTSSHSGRGRGQRGPCLGMPGLLLGLFCPTTTGTRTCTFWSSLGWRKSYCSRCC